MNKRVDELSDEDAVDMTVEMMRAAEEAEKRAAKARARADDDADDDDHEDDDDADLDEAFEDEDDDDDDSDDDTGSDDDDDDDELDDSLGDDEDDDVPAVARVPKRGRRKDGKPKTKAELRIEELASKRREAELEAFNTHLELQEERQQRKALEDRIAALEAGGAPAGGAKAPNPSDFEYGEVDPKYLDAKVEFKVAAEREKFKKEQKDALSDAEKTRLAEHYKKVSIKAESDGAKKYGDNFNIVKQTPFSGEVARAVLDSDHPVDISYYLARNLGKLRELTNMEPPQRAKIIGQLEERFSARTSAGKKRSKAPDTPGRRAKPKAKKVDSRYGPEDQDAFDKLFWGQ